jgi:hypothetical protein
MFHGKLFQIAFVNCILKAGLTQKTNINGWTYILNQTEYELLGDPYGCVNEA